MKRLVQYVIGMVFVVEVASPQIFVEDRNLSRILQEGKVKTHASLPASSLLESTGMTKPFDVLHYSLNAHLAMVDSSFRGTMAIRCVITQPTDTLWFHSVGLVFDSLLVNGIPASFSLYPSSERFSVYLSRLFAVGETVIVTISYERDLSFLRVEDRQGYYWYRQNYQPGFVLENIGYTMSEPYDARVWMPCFDDPSDKATSEISVEVPSGYVAASNGILTSVISQESTTVFHWREDSPITTYLMCITASKYSTFSHFYHKITNPSDSIEVKYYVWQSDSAGIQFNAVQAFSKTVRMMEMFSRMFGEYPFEKYGMAVVYPFFYGGMEHQTMTTVHRSWVSVQNYPYYEDAIAHELAHQWWGDLVTCETFADVWLNEGFASYAEALWREREYDRASYDQKMQSFLIFNSTWQGAIYDPVAQGLPLFGSSVYHKAAWVLHMLRSLLGDTAFFNVLVNYRGAYGYATATTANFQSIVSSTAGENYNWFFDEWIYGRGWPKYAYTTAWNPGSNSYNVTVYQLQDTLWTTFRTPVEIKIFINGVGTSFNVIDSLRTQMFSFSMPSQPDSLQFDPRNRILKQLVAPPTGVLAREKLPTAYSLHQNYPNPFNPTTAIEYEVPERTHVRIEIFDLLGRLVNTVVNEVKEPGFHRLQVTAEGLASGMYFYRLLTPQFAQVRKMLIMK